LQQRHWQTTVALMDRRLAEDGFERIEFGLWCEDGTYMWFLLIATFDSERGDLNRR